MNETSWFLLMRLESLIPSEKGLKQPASVLHSYPEITPWEYYEPVTGHRVKKTQVRVPLQGWCWLLGNKKELQWHGSLGKKLPYFANYQKVISGEHTIQGIQLAESIGTYVNENYSPQCSMVLPPLFVRGRISRPGMRWWLPWVYNSESFNVMCIISQKSSFIFLKVFYNKKYYFIGIRPLITHSLET